MTPAMVCNRGHEQSVCPYAIQNGVWESMENEPPLASSALWPSQRRFRDALDCVIDFEGERLSGNFTALAIPVLRLGQFLIGLGMKPDPHYPRRNNLALTSSHGMV